MQKRKICIVTGSRAEYGLLYWLINEINNDPELELQLIATGMHLSPEFGLTYKIIEQDGFIINEKVEMLVSSDSPVGISKSMGLGTIGFADALNRLKPDLLVLLGDRYEILSAAQVALVSRIPVAHIHGGESTEGLIDEAIRHAVTKMAHIHFVAAEPYRKRVIQFGETPENVFNFGAIGLDNIKMLNLLTRDEFQDSIGLELAELNFLVTYHPVTLNEHGSAYVMKCLLNALNKFPKAKIIITKPNSDTYGRAIIQIIDEYVSRYPHKVISFKNMGQVRYLSALKFVDVVIGNSSSGLIEVPAFSKATINIGDRQRGRLKASSVIDCEEDESSIYQAIKEALSHDFQKALKHIKTHYGEGNVSLRIKDTLKQIPLNGLIKKRFCDLDYKL